MLSDLPNIEHLVLDDSFINYCLDRNEEDRLFWETYIELYPDKKTKILEARQLVIGFHKEFHHSSATKRPFIYRIISIAAVLLLVAGTVGIVRYLSSRSAPVQLADVYADSSSSNFISYVTGKGERRTIVLPDSTVVQLNVASKLLLTNDFNRQNRNVFLEGEALFSVQHNAALPFKVQTGSYEVRVLGTVFNIRAYPAESNSETTLLKGKVKLYKPDGGHITLQPLQKVIFENQKLKPPTPRKADGEHFTIQHIMPIVKNEEGDISEIAWTENTLEFQNESLLEIKGRLERWYDCSIEWEDSTLNYYRFTGSFKNEPIEKILEALQYSYPFNFTINNKKIILSK